MNLTLRFSEVAADLQRVSSSVGVEERSKVLRRDSFVVFVFSYPLCFELRRNALSDFIFSWNAEHSVDAHNRLFLDPT